MKTALVIAHSFPPAGGSGVQRTLKFVKYLPSFGWRPVVLTPRDPGTDYHDHSLVDEIPQEAKVYRTASIEPYKWYARFRKPSDSYLRRKSAGERRGNLLVRISTPIARALFRGGRCVARNFVFVPDFHIGWIPFAVVKGVRVIHKEKVSVIYATGDPWSDFLIALFLNRLTGTPFVMDMRDPWTLQPGKSWDSGIRKAAEEFWERRCVSAARKVINVTEAANAQYIEKYGVREESKFECITQGFDPRDFEGVTGRRTDKFTISATSGFQTEQRVPRSFLQALKSLLDEDQSIKEHIQVNLMGMSCPTMSDTVEGNGLGNLVEIIPYGPHRRSIQLLADSDVLLLNLNRVGKGSASAVTGARVFEYLAAGKPILAAVPLGSAAAETVVCAKAGIVVDPDDVPGIARAIQSLYSQYKNGTLAIERAGDTRKFERSELTRRLAEMLDEAALGRGT